MTTRELRPAALHALSIVDAAARCSAVDSLMELNEVDPDRNLTDQRIISMDKNVSHAVTFNTVYVFNAWLTNYRIMYLYVERI